MYDFARMCTRGKAKTREHFKPVGVERIRPASSKLRENDCIKGSIRYFLYIYSWAKRDGMRVILRDIS